MVTEQVLEIRRLTVTSDNPRKNFTQVNANITRTNIRVRCGLKRSSIPLLLLANVLLTDTQQIVHDDEDAVGNLSGETVNSLS